MTTVIEKKFNKKKRNVLRAGLFIGAGNTAVNRTDKNLPAPYGAYILDKGDRQLMKK